MIKEFKEELFDCNSRGYVVLSRQVMLYLIAPQKEYDCIRLYAYMLTHAQYSPLLSYKGFIVERGELDMSTEELCERTSIPRTTLYRMVRILEKKKLICRKYMHNHQYFAMNRYEDHCGRAVRPEEHTPAPPSLSPAQNQTYMSFEDFFGFYHFLMQTEPVEKEKARAEWQKMSLEEREEASRNIERFKNATKNSKFKKRACNYLKEKCYKM